MKLGLIIVAVAFTVVAGTAIAADIDLSKLPPASDKKDLTYEKDIQPILKTSCFGCHGAQGRPKAGLRLDSLEAALKGGTDGKFIVPGNGTKSQLVLAVSRLDPEKAMPPTRRGRGPRGGQGGPGMGTNAPAGGVTNAAAGQGGMGGQGGQGRGPAGPPPKNLTPEEVGLIRAWIDQGAK